MYQVTVVYRLIFQVSDWPIRQFGERYVGRKNAGISKSGTVFCVKYENTEKRAEIEALLTRVQCIPAYLYIIGFTKASATYEVGTEGYMFCTPLSVLLTMLQRLWVLCFRNISSICWWIFTTLLSLEHPGTKINWLGLGSNIKGQGHIIAAEASGTRHCMPSS